VVFQRLHFSNEGVDTPCPTVTSSRLAQPGAFTDFSGPRSCASGARALLTQGGSRLEVYGVSRKACRSQDRGGASSVCSAPWPSSGGARDHDRHRGQSLFARPRGARPQSCRGRSASGTRPRSCRHNARRSKSLEVLIPVLYLKGHPQPATLREALAALVGQGRRQVYRRRPSPVLKGGVGPRSMRAGRSAIFQPSATSIAGPTASILEARARGGRRSASWSSSARRPEGRKELVGFTDGNSRELTIVA